MAGRSRYHDAALGENMSHHEKDPPARSTEPAGPAEPSSAPRCYRHSDRETHIRCTRCERPICPECMVSASVGFQCPACVREGNRGARSARTIAGGRLASREGLVTKILIGINVAAFLIAQLARDAFVDRLILVGRAGFFASLGEPGGVATGEWYRLLTAAFLHVRPWHLLLNMVGLWIFGVSLESSLGRARFTALYLLSALGGSVVSYAFSSSAQLSLGASGAIFGLLGATLVIVRRLRHNMRPLLALLAINVVYGFLVPGIDWRAHLGGLATGLVLGTAFAYAPRDSRTLVQFTTGVGVFLALLALTAIRTTALTG